MNIKYSIKSIFLVMFLHFMQQVQGQTKYGNYTDSKIGDINNQTLEALLYRSDREWLYDFDGSSPFSGITTNSGTISSNSDFYMSAPKSMQWSTSQGASLIFDADIELPNLSNNFYHITFGVFQTNLPTGSNHYISKFDGLLQNIAQNNTNI